jgi:phosphate:Na+ symporter
MLPLTAGFARLIRTLVRSDRERPADALEMLPSQPTDRTIGPAHEALRQTFLDLLAQLHHLLGGTGGGQAVATIPLPVLQADLDRIELVLDQVRIAQLDPLSGQRLLHMLHGLDHLQRLHERCEEETDRALTVRQAGDLRGEREALLATVQRIGPLARDGQWSTASEAAEELARRIHRRVTPFRETTLRSAAAGRIDAEAATDLLEAVRWMRRVSQHLRRFCRHMDATTDGGSPAAVASEGEVRGS